MRSNVRIPSDAVDDFQALLNTPVDSLHKLAECLAACDPERDVEDLAAHCIEKSDISIGNVESIIRILINMALWRRGPGQDTQSVLATVEESLARALMERWVTQYRSAWQERIPVMQALLPEDGAIEKMSKVRELIYESQSLFLKSAVLTDVRFIFDSNATKIGGALILHTMALDYIEGGERRSLHLSITTDEILKLINQLQRAQKKEKVSLSLLEDDHIPELTPERNPT